MCLPHGPGREARGDYEYERAGVASMFMLLVPLGGWREVDVRETRTAIDFAHVLHYLSDVHFPEADKITLGGVLIILLTLPLFLIHFKKIAGRRTAWHVQT